MSSSQTVQVCSTCGTEYIADNMSNPPINPCPMCSLYSVPVDFSNFIPTTPVAEVEQVQGIYIPANSPQPSLFPANINIHYEPGRPRRAPQLEFLGPQNTLFYIKIQKGPAGQLLSSPYYVYFQTHHRNLPNQCVSTMTRGNPKYKWFGDIVVLKCDGTRMERFKAANLADDMSNIAWFFLNEAILG